MPRQHVHEEEFEITPERLFAQLVTPSAIRSWWSAARAIVMPVEGGTWAAVWGDSEDDPEYVTSATITGFDPPRSMVLEDYRYHARSGPLPFEARFRTEFSVSPTAHGARLRVQQDGFPDGPEGDDFLAGCEKGWRDTFAGMRRHLAAQESGRHGRGERA